MERPLDDHPSSIRAAAEDALSGVSSGTIEIRRAGAPGWHPLQTALLDGWQSHADDMRVETVPGCGHFIVDERPELVAQRIAEGLTPTR